MKSVAATVLEVAGLGLATAGAFTFSITLGLLAAGAAAFTLGYQLEDR